MWAHSSGRHGTRKSRLSDTEDNFRAPVSIWTYFPAKNMRPASRSCRTVWRRAAEAAQWRRQPSAGQGRRLERRRSLARQQDPEAVDPERQAKRHVEEANRADDDGEDPGPLAVLQ